MEWLKARLRNTFVQRWVHAWAPRLGFTRATSDDQVNDAYNRETIEVMKSVVARDGSCVDIGAHTGAILRHMVEIAPDGEHHAFEPLPHLAQMVRDRFPGVRVHEAAVSDKSGQAEFQFVENAPAYSGLRRRIYDRPDPKVVSLQVAVTTLDETLPAGQPIAFIKIDIEGGEYHALRGAANTIREWRPVIVFEAGLKSTGQYGVTPDSLFTLVTDFGYELSTMRRWLDRREGYTREEFERNWENGPDYYFIASDRQDRP